MAILPPLGRSLPEALQKLALDLESTMAIEHATYLRALPDDDVGALAKGLAQLLPAPVSVFQLTGDYLEAGEGDKLLGPLKAGTTVVLGATGAVDWPGAFSEYWQTYLDDHANVHIPVARHLTLAPDPELKNGGFLAVLHADDREPLPRDVTVRRLDNPEREVLEKVGTASRQSVTKIGVRWQSGTVAITMKDLCLLHGRDPSGTPRRSLLEALNGQGPLTWTDLQELLYAGPSQTWVLDTMRERSRLSDERYAFGLAAFDYLNERKRPLSHDVPVYPDVYHVIWSYHWLAKQGGAFRGQSDVRWQQQTTLLRPDLSGHSPDLQTVYNRIRETEHFLSELRSRQEELFGRALDEDALLAIAQHYGFPTPLLDYTESLAVAAFFATLGAGRLQSDERRLGIIYHLTPSKPPGEQGDRGYLPSARLGEFDLLDQARIRVGEVRFIQPDIPGPDNRIARQHGLFVSGFQANDFQNYTINRIRFWQIPGEVFEDPAAGITEAVLLPPDSRLARLAAEVRQDFENRRKQTPRLHPAIGSTRVAETRILGSTGTMLFAQVNDSAKFFKDLNAEAANLAGGDRAIQTLAQIFNNYFAGCRARADVGELPDISSAGTGDADTVVNPAILNPLARAISELAKVFDAPEDELRAAAVQHLSEEQRRNEFGKPVAAPLEPSNPGQRIALAGAIYLAAWERLQYAEGQATRDVVFAARCALKGM